MQDILFISISSKREKHEMTEYTKRAELLARPIRFAFILGVEPTTKEIVKIIKYCCETFGGARNIIIPSNGAKFEDWWGYFLTASDPDVILYTGRFTDINSIKSQITSASIQPFKAKSWRGESAKSMGKFSPLPVDNIYRAKIAEAVHYSQERKFNVVTAPTKGKDVSLFNYFEYGTLSRNFVSKYKQLLKFATVTKIKESIRELVSDPIELTKESITHDEYEYFSTCFDDTVLGPFVAVTGDKNSLDDCCLYWNWKALASNWMYVRWIGKEELSKLFVQPNNVFEGRDSHAPANAKILTSVTIGQSTSETSKEILSHVLDYSQNSSHAGYSYRHPAEYDKKPAIARYFCDKDTYLTIDNKVRITRRIPSPYQYQDCLVKSLVVDLELKSEASEDKRGMLLSPRQKAEDALTIETKEDKPDVRISKSGLTILLPWTLSSGTVNLTIKSDWEIISSIFQRGGLVIDESPSGKHIRKSIDLVGSIEELSAYYQNKVTRTMLDAFKTPHSSVAKSLEGRRREAYRRSYTVHDLKNEVSKMLAKGSSYRKNQICNEVDRWIESWLNKGILVSGFQLSCQDCDFEGWYPIGIVGEDYICLRCGAKNRRPHQSNISYRLHESVYQAHSENMVVPILTLNFLKAYASESFMFCVPMKLERDNPHSPDIDIVAIVDGEIVIGECKKPNKLRKDLFNRYDSIASRINAENIVFSSIDRENTCGKNKCEECSNGVKSFYCDEIFTHGIPSDRKQWGTRELIREFREKQSEKGVWIHTFCAYYLGFEE